MLSKEQIFDHKPGKNSPEFHWQGKCKNITAPYYPAQLKERYGCDLNRSDSDRWFNKLYWGDNIEVMGHLLEEFREKIDLIYLDPPFNSSASYKKKIVLHGRKTGKLTFEEKQYDDIWTNENYLQFMYERLVLMKDLLSDKGSIYLHCDWHKSHYLRMIMDEVFGPDNFRNEIVWKYTGSLAPANDFPRKHDTIFRYSKTQNVIFNHLFVPYSEAAISRFDKKNEAGRYKITYRDGKEYKTYMKEGKRLEDVWEIPILMKNDDNFCNYPTQKPEALLERIIKTSSNPEINGEAASIVFDCFMGSGTAQAVAMKLGRRFIGADINPGAVQTSVKRLVKVKKELENSPELSKKMYTSFELYHVINNDFLRDPMVAGRALVQRDGDKLIIREFYPANLIKKLGLEGNTVFDWKELVDSVMIDYNYGGAEMMPSVIDIPGKKGFVKGEYDIPENTGRIKVKITDLLFESLELIAET